MRVGVFPASRLVRRSTGCSPRAHVAGDAGGGALSDEVSIVPRRSSRPSASGGSPSPRSTRHQGGDAAPLARAGHRGAHPALDHDGRVHARVGVDGVLLQQRPGRPGHRRLGGRPRCRRRSTPTPAVRHLLLATRCSAVRSASAPTSCATATGDQRPGARPAQPAVEITAQNHGFAVDAPLDAVSETPYGRVEVSHGVPQRRRRRGAAVPGREGLLGAVPPRGGGGPHDSAYLFDRFADPMEGLNPCPGVTIFARSW